MPNTVYFRYGGKKGLRQKLNLSKDLLVVRARGARSLLDTALSAAAHKALTDLNSLFRIPEAGIEVFRCHSERATRARRDEARLILRKEADVRFAGRALINAAGRPVLYTENLFVQFDEDLSLAACKRALRDAGLSLKRPLRYATNAFFAELPEGTGQKVFQVAMDLLAKPEVLLCHPELVQETGLKSAFPQQWHLKRTSVGGQAVDAHANVEAAWALSEGEGTTIAIIDDGVDLAHEEFQGAGKIVASRDMLRQNADANPQSAQDRHGTACAGVAVANGAVGASGVAPKAHLMPIRLAARLGSQAEADAFIWAADHGADVISCSWGPMDGEWWNDNDPAHNAVFALPDSTRLAIDYAVQNGRNGRGCVITWAAGNGNEPVDNDGYASYEKVIAVAACNDQGKRAAYSDKGDAIWCAFPSSHGLRSLTPGIWTTDNSGGAGYNSGDLNDGDAAGNYTNSFGGTSSACPGAAGVAALVLARNPELRWDQVKQILKASSDRIDTRNGKYDSNGHSPWYGFGRLNAKRAVELAQPSAPAGTAYTAIHRTLKAVPIQDLKTSSIQVAVGDTAALKDIKVLVDLEHTWIGDLTLKLRSPGGQVVVLHDREGGGGRNIHKSYDTASTPALSSLTGSPAQGVWKLEVRDNVQRDTGKIISFGLELGF